MNRNIVIDTDAYKWTHHLQYPENLDGMCSYGEARTGSDFPTTFFIGLQPIIKTNFMVKVTDEMINEAEEDCIDVLGYKEYFNREVWERVRDLGYLPIRICAVPEGTEVQKGNVLFTIEATEKWFAKTAQSLETILMHYWYPTAVATRSGYIKRSLLPLFIKSCENPEIMSYLVQDFGSRGTTCTEASAIGGIGHLLHFRGSDNNTANKYIKDFYGMRGRAKSVWATEHSVAMSFGPGKGEFDYVNHQLDNAPDDAIISVVGDTYDIYNFTENVVGSEEIMNKIINRKGKFVIRPDSGDFFKIIPDLFKIIERKFGYRLNKLGYKVYDKIGLLQGDGMNEKTIVELYSLIVNEHGISAENLVTGSGGGLLQVNLNRDTIAAAIKPSYISIGSERINVQKNPKTQNSKKSKTGLLKLIIALEDKNRIHYETISDVNTDKEIYESFQNELVPIFENGKFLKEYNFEEIIKNSEKSFVHLM